MKKVFAGFLLGIMVTSLLTIVGFSSNQVIGIYIDGTKILPDVSPQIIDGRVMVPARFIAEPLGAIVE